MKIKDFDMFGHPVLLNFNNKGPVHLTTIGGIASIIVKLFALAYFALRVKMMINYEADNLKTTIVPTDFEKLGEVDFDKTGLQLMVSLSP
jgi:hypothetical protein